MRRLLTLLEADTLGKRIKYFRQLRGLTPRELGVAIGLSRSSVAEMENSVTTPSAARVQAIAKVLDVVAGDLYPIDWQPRQRLTRAGGREASTPVLMVGD